jgi:hypothetical protein
VNANETSEAVNEKFGGYLAGMRVHLDDDDLYYSSRKNIKEEKVPDGMAGIKETTHDNNEENIRVYEKASLAGNSGAAKTGSAI